MINESDALRPVFMVRRMVLCPLIKVIIFRLIFNLTSPLSAKYRYRTIDGSLSSAQKAAAMLKDVQKLIIDNR